MSKMHYPHITDDLAYELRRGSEWPSPPWLAPTQPLVSRVKPIAAYLFEPTGHVGRLRAYLDARYLGDVAAFTTGWRAYPPGADAALPGVYTDRMQAAWALRVRG